jgi:hypothetical protein
MNWGELDALPGAIALSRNRSKKLGDFGCDEEQTQLRGPLLE